MALYRKRRAGLVISPSPWSINTVLLVTVFVVTSALAYYWGHRPGPDARSEPQCADASHREWKQQTEMAHAAAMAEAERARLAWQLAEAERQEFVDRFLREHEPAARPAAPDPAQQRQPARPAPPDPVENPEWLRLAERRASLERRRAESLVHRTPAHPEVQEMEHDLAEVQRAMAGVPRWTAPEAGVGPASEEPAPPAPAASPGVEVEAERLASERAAARRQVEQLGRKADQARSRYEELALAERAAWLAHVREPEIEVPDLLATEGVSSDVNSDHALSASLLAGLAMMVGVGMFAAGAAMEPALRSAEQVRSLVGVPVIAQVTLPGLKPAGSGWPRVWLRLASCLGGLVLMAGCVGLLYRAVAG